MRLPALLLPPLLLAAPAALAQADGTLLARTPCEPLPRYEEVAVLARASRREPPDEPEYRRLARSVACERLVYASGGLRVVAILVRPERPGNRRLPVMIYNHGGGPENALPERVLMEEARWVAAGYLFLAPQYRGAGGGEGQDEYGGADVTDVLSLFPLLRSLDFADTANVFMYGHSRGGMMTYQALRAGVPVRAAAVTAGVADYAGRRARGGVPMDSAAVERRSAVRWPDRLGVPLLLLHGGDDAVVPVEQARRLAAALDSLGRPHELVIYPGADHNLSDRTEDVLRRIRAWFQRHRAR